MSSAAHESARFFVVNLLHPAKLRFVSRDAQTEHTIKSRSNPILTCRRLSASIGCLYMAALVGIFAQGKPTRRSIYQYPA